MSIISMSHIEIVAPRANADALMSTIQDLGSLQIEEVPLAVIGTRSFLHRGRLSSEQNIQHDKLLEVLRVLSELKPFFKSVRHPGNEELDKARSELPVDDATPMLLRVSRIKRRADGLRRKRKNIAHDIEFLSRFYDRLDYLNAIRESDELPKSAHYVAVVVPSSAQKHLSHLEKQLQSDAPNGCKVLRAKGSGGRSRGTEVAVIAFSEGDASEVRRAIDYAGLHEFHLPGDARKLPLMDAVSLLRDRLRAFPGRLAEIDRQIEALRTDNYASVIATEQVCQDSIARLDCMSAGAHSEFLTVLHAWAPTDDIGHMQEVLARDVGPEVVVSVLTDHVAHASQIPVRLENTSVVRPFERMLKVLSSPLYGAIDPTSVMALIFPVFFGLVLGDFGYGLFILVGAIWARRRYRHIEIARDITSIAKWCGVTSMLFGIVYGEFLGDLGERMGFLPLRVNDFTLVPLWQHRRLIIHELLVLTIIIGCLHIALGLLLGIAEAIRTRSWRHLGERGGMLMGLVAAIILLAPVDFPGFLNDFRAWIAVPLLLSGLFILILGAGPAGPIELIGLLANILSYSRLMALGIAGMVMADLANVAATSQPHYLLAILVGIPIHLFAVGLGAMEATIHVLRLHYVEFLPKFFVGDGRSYVPLCRKGEQHAD